MYKPVYVPFAVTQHGERVEPKTATQEDYDTLLCEFCRLKISVVIDELTGVKVLFIRHCDWRQQCDLQHAPTTKLQASSAMGRKQNPVPYRQ